MEKIWSFFVSVPRLVRRTALIGGVFTLALGCTEEANTVMFKKLLSEYEAAMIPLDNKIQLAVFQSYISGTDADFQISASLYNQKAKLLSSKTDFSTLEQIRKSGKVSDELLRRQLEIIYGQYRVMQLDTSLLFQINDVEQHLVRKFSIYRAEMGKAKMTRNQLDSIFRFTNNAKQMEAAWMASKQVGDLVSSDLIDLVKSKNKLAKKLGFKDYFELSLTENGSSKSELERILANMDNETRSTYSELKKGFDQNIAKRFGIPVSKLGIWHYQSLFTQTSLDLLPVQLDSSYTGKNMVSLVADFFKGLDLPVDRIVKSSDFSEKSGKNQFSAVINTDRKGDVRVLENVTSSSASMQQLLSSISQACYYKNIDSTLPYTLRIPAHPSMLNAVGSIFSHFAVDPDWLTEVLGVSPAKGKLITDEAKHKLLEEKVIFARWSLLLYHFEKSLYADPDQDLNKLWWELCHEYLLVNRPDKWNKAYWAAVPQFLFEPCQFYNYILGDIIASHLFEYMNKNLVVFNDKRTFVDNKRIGMFLKTKIFEPGARLSWEEIIQNATGEPINTKYFIKSLKK